jgi:hypothetical protein
MKINVTLEEYQKHLQTPETHKWFEERLEKFFAEQEKIDCEPTSQSRFSQRNCE